MRVRYAPCLIAIIIACGSVAAWTESTHAQWVHEGKADEGKWNLGFRAGLSILSQEGIESTSSGVGPVLNLQAMYGLNKWFRAGFMLEWERHGFDAENGPDLGTLNTVSLLPTLEFRPGRFYEVVPYLSTGIGVNINSFSEDDGVPEVDVANTFAFRLAGGLDFPLTSHLMLNTEVAWKRNRGTVGTAANFDSSSMNLLVGIRYAF